MSSPRRARSGLLAVLPLSIALASCGGTGGDGGGTDPGTASGAAASDAALSVVTSFYPLQFVTERVAGDRAEVSVLTAPGTDPHDLELTPKQLAGLGEADLVVVQSSMQPAVDDAVEQAGLEHLVDVTEAADLMAAGESHEEHEEHAEEEGHDEHDHGNVDPHFWLDPERLGHVAEAVADELSSVDPEGARTYEANAAALVKELDALDQEMAAGLTTCERREVVSTHEAFGYLGARYDLEMVGIAGISPEAEPSPARLAEISAQVKEHDVTAIYAEPLLPSGIAETVAKETGVEVLTLDPVEGITDASAGDDYLAVMRANLASLREGLSCS